MSLPPFDMSLPDDFSGEARLFPLPNLVLFPNVVQALHIFEPRYCDMLEEALATDRLITLALLKPGWEQKYMGNPPLFDTVCIGKILTHSPTTDDRHNILLAGVKRARLKEEIVSPSAFRRANVELLDDFYQPDQGTERLELRQELMDSISQSFDGNPDDSLSHLFSKQIPLGVLSDVIAFSSKLPLELKQTLLEQTRVECRCRILIRYLKQAHSQNTKEIPPVKETEKGNGSDRFPPPFSQN